MSNPHNPTADTEDYMNPRATDTLVICIDEESIHMSQDRLRIYCGPENDDVATVSNAAQPDTVTIPLGEIFPLLADAVDSRRTWLRDFEEDEITVSSDLYEMILAYQHYRRPSA
jgi:hypothetical protein